MIEGIQETDAHAYISKYIEANRVHVFEIVTQYKVDAFCQYDGIRLIDSLI